MALTLRPYTPDDAETVVRINNVVFPEYPETVDEFLHQEKNRDPKIRWRRVMAEADGAVVGYGSYDQWIDMYHPRKFNVYVSLLPEHQGQGYGRTVYDFLMAALEEFEPLLVRCHVREDYPRSLRFVQERGFVEEMRDWESRLDPRAFDPAPFDEKRRQVEEQGIIIQSLSALAADPERDRKLFEMDWQITLDMPTPDTLTQPTFEHFQKSVLNNPNFCPDGWFVALDGDRYVGESSVWKSQANDELYVGATGVLRDYRRRGIATALKLAATGYAGAVGCPCLKTWNATTNRAMLSINEAMGFVKQPAWISFAKTLREEEA